jgi:hypothetical protein
MLHSVLATRVSVVHRYVHARAWERTLAASASNGAPAAHAAAAADQRPMQPQHLSRSLRSRHGRALLARGLHRPSPTACTLSLLARHILKTACPRARLAATHKSTQEIVSISMGARCRAGVCFTPLLLLLYAPCTRLNPVVPRILSAPSVARQLPCYSTSMIRTRKSPQCLQA